MRCRISCFVLFSRELHVLYCLVNVIEMQRVSTFLSSGSFGNLAKGASNVVNHANGTSFADLERRTVFEFLGEHD